MSVDSQKPWIAQYSVGDLAASAGIGLTPVGTVMGTAALVPLMGSAPAISMEVSASSGLATQGWEKALAQLVKEALTLGADGVASLRLERRNFTDNVTVYGFRATGTAVIGLPRKALWMTECDPNELLVLARAGFSPIALAFGCCTWHQSSYGWTQKRGSMGQWLTQEITPATQAYYTARSVALQRMQAMATEAGAVGIVGSRINTLAVSSPGGVSDGFTAGIEAFGTAIAPYPGPPSPPIQTNLSMIP